MFSTQFNWDRGISGPMSLEELSRLSGLSIRTCARGRAELRARGFIIPIEGAKGGKGIALKCRVVAEVLSPNCADGAQFSISYCAKSGTQTVPTVRTLKRDTEKEEGRKVLRPDVRRWDPRQLIEQANALEAQKVAT